MAKILIVEDEIDLATPIAQYLGEENHLVEICSNGQDALERLRVYQYDLLILDWMLPGVSGVDICRKFRSQGGDTPILMLTARSEIEEKETGLDAGADDYLTKPFHLKELAARIRALLRRPGQASNTELVVADLVLDSKLVKVTRAGHEIQLLPKEFSLLEFLMRHPSQVFSADHLIDRVWSSDSLAMPETVRTHIKTLRRKIDLPGHPGLIKTVHGVGYKIEADNV